MEHADGEAVHGPGGPRLVNIELELADLIAAERAVGRILAEPGARSSGFHALTNW
jgi:hypothetical protein